MATESQYTTRRPIYYGWWIVLAGFVALAVVEFADSTIPDRLFYPADTTYRVFAAVVSSVILAFSFILLLPVAGHLADRYGPRVVVTPALLIAGLIIIALSRVAPGWLSYTFAILVGSGLAATIHIGMATAVANWFTRNRGKAFALLLTGPAVALFLPALSIGLWLKLLTFVDDASEAFGGLHFSTWQVLATGIAVIVVTAPPAILLRRKPDVAVARREQEEFTENDLNAEPAPQPLRAILKSRQYLFYVAALSLQVSAIGAIRIAAGTALGDSLTSIGARWFGDVILATVVVVAVGLFVTGALADRYDRRIVVAGILGAQLVCSLVLVLFTGDLAVLALAIAIGGGVGALSAANLALQAELWGRRRFGLLLGIQMSAVTLLTAIWTGATVAIWASFSSRPPFGLGDNPAGYPFVILSAVLPLAIALILILLMKRPQSAVPNPPTAKAEPQVA